MMPKNLAPASGKNMISDSIGGGLLSLIMTSPTPNKNALGTKCPSILERTLTDAVYTPSSNGEVVTMRDNSPS